MLINAGSSKLFMTLPSSSGATKVSEEDPMAALASMHVHVVEYEDAQTPDSAIEDWDIGRQSETAEVVDLTED